MPVPDYEVASLREELRRYREVGAAIFAATEGHDDLTINGVLYRAIAW